jgi:hypothetical protein
MTSVVVLVGFGLRLCMSVFSAVSENAMNLIIQNLIEAVVGASLARRSGDVALDPQGTDAGQTDGNH